MNTICIIGNLTRDPELSFTDKGTAVCKFSIAHNKNKDEAFYVNVVVFGKRGETTGQYMKKGSKVAITGQLDVRKWEKDGKLGTSVDIIASEVTFLTSTSKQTDAPDTTMLDQNDIPF
jgi:single-strand DNA-binding protein